MFWNIRRESEFSTHVPNCMCIDKEVQLKFKLQHTETSSAAADLPSAFFIAQQYSSANFASLRFQSLKEKSARLSKMMLLKSLKVFF
jgi:hypothetical protein